MRYKRIANKIVIEQSRTGAIVLGVFLLIIIIGWPWIILGKLKHYQEVNAIALALNKEFIDIPSESIFYIVAYLPLFLSPILIKNFWFAVAGREIIFDGTAKTIFTNGKALLNFSEIQNFDFKHMENDDIKLDFILHNGKKVKLGKIGIIKNADTYKADIRDVIQFSEKTPDTTPGKEGSG